MGTADLIAVAADPAQSGSSRLVLRGRLTVGCAGELHRTAVALVTGNADVTIDCAAVEYLDVSAVQVVLCLSRELTRAGRRWVIAGVPAAVEADFLLLGLKPVPAPGR